MINCEEIASRLRPIEKVIYDNIKNQFLRTWFVTDKHARDLADTIALRGDNSDAYRDIVNYNEYIFEKYNVDLFECWLNIKSEESLYSLFLKDGEARVNEKTLSRFKPIEKLIYDAIDNPNLRALFATDDHARELADTVVVRGYNSDTYRDIAKYNAYISEKYGASVFDCCPDIETTEAMYNMFAMVEDTADDQDDYGNDGSIVNVTLVKSRTNTTKKAIPPMVFNRTLGKFVQYEEPKIVNYKACWEALQDHVNHVIDRLSENKESSRNASTLLSAYLDISNQMKFIEELDLNSHWAKLSTADKIKALQNADIQ
jgi:hypothetical protein